MVTRHLLGQAALKADEGHDGAVKLVQRLGSAASLNIRLHGSVPDGVYRGGGDLVPAFVEVAAPTDNELHTELQTLITRLMKLLTSRECWRRTWARLTWPSLTPTKTRHVRCHQMRLNRGAQTMVAVEGADEGSEAVGYRD